MAELNQTGRAPDDVIADLESKRANDVKWEDGRAFGMVYDGGPGVHEVAERAASIYLHENALNTKAFPSLAEIQSEVVGWTASLLSEPAASGAAKTLRTYSTISRRPHGGFKRKSLPASRN